MAATDVAALGRRAAIEHLSGGERGRVLLARVLAGEPDWLLADEPLASLDPAHQIDVAAMLRSVAAAGRGVVLVVHDLGTGGPGSRTMSCPVEAGARRRGGTPPMRC